MVKRLFLFFILTFILISFPSLAEDISISHSGNCDIFNLTLNASGFPRGLYDLKIDNLRKMGDLEIYNSNEGWKSAFFYLQDYFKINNNRTDMADVKIRYNASGNLTILGKLRKGSRKWHSDKYTIAQDCPPKKNPKENLSREPNITLDYKGKCKKFNVTLTAENFKEDTYDVKVNVKSKNGGRSAGEIYDPNEGWKSSYYYVDDVFEIGKTPENLTLKVRTETEKNLSIVGKLKKDSKTWESGERKIFQQCPENDGLNRIFVLLIALIAILLLQVGIIVYIK